MYEQPKPRRKLRLPQLAKFNRRVRLNGPRSEFIAMCHSIEYNERLNREHIERERVEADRRRQREAYLAGRAAA